jgi:hypothetical protein
MQTMHATNLYLSASRLLPKDRSIEGVESSETLTSTPSPEVSRLAPSSRIRRIGMRWLWWRQSQISWKWIGGDLAFIAR